jgi:hypothetical protein
MGGTPPYVNAGNRGSFISELPADLPQSRQLTAAFVPAAGDHFKNCSTSFAGAISASVRALFFECAMS